MNKFHNKFRETGSRIRQAFIQLLDRMNFPDITVTELCREAGINRSTFYLHYSNISEIVTEIEQEADDCYVPVDEQYFKKMAQSNEEGRRKLQNGLITQYLENIRAHYSVCYAAAKNPELFHVVERDQKKSAQLYAAACRACGITDDRKVLYITEYFTKGTRAIITMWVLGGCKESDAFVCEVIDVCNCYRPQTGSATGTE